MPLAAPREITFNAYEDDDGGYYARAVGYGIFTLGDDWEDLEEMARDATLCYFDEGEPEIIKIHLVRREAIAT